MNSSQSSNSQGNSQQATQREQDQTERVWKLKGGTMHVAACGKKTERDLFMTLDLVFKFDGDPTPKVVEIKYDPDVLKNAWYYCGNNLGVPVFLEDCSIREMRAGFVEYIHQECALFKDRVRELADQVADGVIGSTSLLRGKKTLHFYKPTVERFGNGDDSKYYLIACEIFCLTGELKKLTSEEMDNLPVIISWKGPRLNFSTDEKECFKLITDIIFDFNQMQDQEFVSFPVAVFAAHLAGQVYRQIIEARANFSSQMSVSGPASNTGKSLAQTMCMLIFLGEIQDPTTTLTPAIFYEMVEVGNIYVKELSVKKTSNKFNTIDPSFLNFSVPVFWERNERRVKVGKGSKVYKVNGVMHMDGNILLSDLERVLPDHVLGKLKLNYTGAVPFDHPDEHELCQNILKNAKAAFEFLPVLMKLAVETCVPAVTKEEMDTISHALKKPNDKREGQVIASYDRVFKALKKAIEKYNLRIPAVFQSDQIDRRSSTYFNTNKEEAAKMEEIARALINVADANLGKHFIEHSERSPSFRINLADPGSYTPQLYQMLKGLKSTPSTFAGKTQRVAFLLESLLKEETIARLHSLSCRHDQLFRLAAEEEARQWNNYADKFYERAAQWGKEETEEHVPEHEEQEIEDPEIDTFEATAAKKKRNENFKCENQFCRDFGKVFKYASMKAKHDRAAHHVNAKGPN